MPARPLRIAFVLPRGPLYRHGSGAFGRGIRYAPLTMPTLVGMIPEDVAVEATVCDEGVETVRADQIRADLVALTSITGASPRAFAYADHFRARGIPVVMGGVHATLAPEEAAEHADAVVTGVAVETWPRLLRDFVAGRLERRYDAGEHVPFARWPLPRRDCYASRRRRFITVNSVQATYGCPCRCEFCVTPHSCRGYHHRPVEEVVEDVRAIRARHFVFVDPSPIEDRAYALALYRALTPLGRRWVSPSTIRMAFDDELLTAAAASGCRGLLIGFESVSQASLDGIGKRFNEANEFAAAVRRFHAAGVAVMGCFVFGLDGDDEGVFERTVEFVERTAVDLPRFTVCTPYPGTDLHRRLESEGRILERNWLMYDCQHVVIRPARMSAQRLQAGLEWAWRQCYTPRSIASRLARAPRFTREVMTDVSDITGRS